MTPITVFEDPWPKDKAKIPLETVSLKHFELIEIFLKLIPHFQTDEKGQILQESLVYSEWRYINYIRFLHLKGVSAYDCPPPWDVAMIWYCHLLSPYHFHRHLWDSDHISYGLNHHQFPVTKLVRLYQSGKWSDSVEDLAEVFNRQVTFWKAVLKARESDPDFASRQHLTASLGDYERFIKLHGIPPTMKKAPYKDIWKLDMDALPVRGAIMSEPRNREFVPPNLTVDLLWHTHRLYPASYWVWSFTTAGRLIDYEPMASVEAAKRTLGETDLEWKKRNGIWYDEKHSLHQDDMEGYFPDAAIVPPGHPARAKVQWTLGGMNPVKERRVGTRGRYYVFEGLDIPFDGGTWDFGGSGDGGGGGDGGSGGGDGGCGGDGGGGGGGGDGGS
ncbi:hypothetical protein CGCVW01_v006822 [Colletotrichum viniferum]|nr:hypothetical protein CGCVW01_v006822 [Colletotrichum viniferum]